jgi:hypothetical protein
MNTLEKNNGKINKMNVLGPKHVIIHSNDFTYYE